MCRHFSAHISLPGGNRERLSASSFSSGAEAESCYNSLAELAPSLDQVPRKCSSPLAWAEPQLVGAGRDPSGSSSDALARYVFC